MSIIFDYILMKKFLQANRKPPVHKTCINNLYLPFSFMVNIVVGGEKQKICHNTCQWTYQSIKNQLQLHEIELNSELKREKGDQ